MLQDERARLIRFARYVLNGPIIRPGSTLPTVRAENFHRRCEAVLEQPAEAHVVHRTRLQGPIRMRCFRRSQVDFASLEPWALTANPEHCAIRVLHRVRPLVHRSLRPETALAVRPDHRPRRHLVQMDLVAFHQIHSCCRPQVDGVRTRYVVVADPDIIPDYIDPASATTPARCIIDGIDELPAIRLFVIKDVHRSRRASPNENGRAVRTENRIITIVREHVSDDSHVPGPMPDSLIAARDVIVFRFVVIRIPTLQIDTVTIGRILAMDPAILHHQLLVVRCTRDRETGIPRNCPALRTRRQRHVVKNDLMPSHSSRPRIINLNRTREIRARARSRPFRINPQSLNPPVPGPVDIKNRTRQSIAPEDRRPVKPANSWTISHSPQYESRLPKDHHLMIGSDLASLRKIHHPVADSCKQRVQRAARIRPPAAVHSVIPYIQRRLRLPLNVARIRPNRHLAA